MWSKLWAGIRSVVQFRVQRWHLATGGSRKVIVVLEDDIWYWVVAHFLAWDCCTRVCDLLHHVPMPRWLRNWEGKWDKDEESCKLSEWYGDTFDVFWHCWIESPFMQWAHSHRNWQGDQQIEISLEDARVKFAGKHELQWIEEHLRKCAEWDAEEAAEEAAEAKE